MRANRTDNSSCASSRRGAIGGAKLHCMACWGAGAPVHATEGPTHARQVARAVPLSPPLRLSPREVSWLLLRAADARTPDETAYAQALLGGSRVVASTCDLAASARPFRVEG